MLRGVFHREKRYKKSGAYRLTEPGHEKAQDKAGHIDPKSRLLVALEIMGSSASAEQLAQATQLTREQVEKEMEHLSRSHLVEGTEEDDADA